MTLKQAFARVEGWYIQGDAPNRPQRNNNPGDIEYGHFAQSFGAVMETAIRPRFAKFPTPEKGWAALDALLRGPLYWSLTIEAAVNRYAPPNENNTVNYVSAVCKWSGCTPDQLVSEVVTAQEGAIQA